jgi:CelD/BcsL family acetyltransferase involved in cellulose biosynthesis
MKIEVLPGRPLPPEIRQGWEKILKEMAHQNPFLSPLWAEVWLKHFGRSLEPKLLLFRDQGGALKGIGHLLESSENGKRRLSLSGSGDVWDYRDFVIHPGWEKKVFQSLALMMKNGSFDFIELNSIAQNSPTADVFPKTMETLGFRVSREIEETVLNLPLPSTWDGFLEALSAKDRHELRRKIRRIEKEGSCEWVGDVGPSSLDEKMDLFLELHRRSRRDKSEFMTPEMESYFRDLAGELLKREWLDLSFLRFQGKEIAAFFSFDFAEIKFVYNSGYDPDFSWYSPGIVLSAYCIRRAIQKGMKGFNFLRGREDYKYHLGAKEEANLRLRAERA